LDLSAAERLSSAADPKGLAALKSQSSDPAAAKAIAGQFGALLMQGIMRGTDGAAMSIAGDGIGGNVVSALFANTMAQAAMSGDKLGLADMLFRAMEAKQHDAASGGANSQTTGALTQKSATAPPVSPASGGGFALAPYWEGDGLRPFSSTIAHRSSIPSTGAAANQATTSNPGRAGFVTSASEPSPTDGWNQRLGIANGESAGPGVASPQAQSFVQRLRPILEEAGRQLGVSPRILLAHAALETGWGRSIAGNNLFGIKAGPSWSGAQVTTMTQEMEDGQMVPQQASFRAYPSFDASVQDYVALISNSPRYRGVIGAGADAAAYGRGLLAGGYATDTEYARKLEAIASGPSLTAGLTAPSQPGGLRLFAAQGYGAID
jgi:flagellar protein FlgJ